MHSRESLSNSDMSTNFPDSIFSISFVGTEGTREKLIAVKLSRPEVTAGIEGGSLVDDIGGSCPVTVI